MPPVAETVADAYAHLADIMPQPLRNLSHGLHIPNLLVRARKPGSGGTPRSSDFSSFEQQLVIKVVTDSEEQRQSSKYQTLGQTLARQDRWDDLLARIRQSDRDRDTTASGLTMADLLVHGARADIVLAAEHALMHGHLDPQAGLDDRIGEFEETLDEFIGDYGAALVLAHTHIDIGWAWRGNGRLDSLSEDNRRNFYRHFDRAGEILEPHISATGQSPALQSARCALLPGVTGAASRVASDFETLIDLDPENPRYMRALGNYLLPRWYGSYDRLDLEARRTAARTFETWGAGGYTWVFFDALLTDALSMNQVDMDYFLDGLDDILSLRGDQQTTNLLAAHTHAASQLAQSHANRDLVDPALAGQFSAAFERIVDTHLREVHPLIWGHAEIGFDNATRAISLGRLMQKGREAAMHAIAERHRDTLARGNMVVFRHTGIEILNA